MYRSGFRFVVGRDDQSADVELSGFAGEASAGDDRHRLPVAQSDPPAEKHDRHRRGAGADPGLPAEIENALTLEKEIALLRVEHIEAREIDLLQILFDLREIGVHGQVGRECARKAVLEIKAAA